MTREDLINVFEETRSLSTCIYRNETREAIKNTQVLIDASSLLQGKELKPQKIEVIQKGTIAACLGVVQDGKKVAALNFADPYTEGGMVLDGVDTQEECICRCTNLYETLIKDECWKQYYSYNRNLDNNTFSDRLIYSEGVTILKNEDYNFHPGTPRIDVITCPAPIFCNDIFVFEKRIKCILGAAYYHGVDTLILGAWGCGAFGNNPEIVAEAFRNVLEEYKIFDRVIFAIKYTNDTPNDNFKVFKQVLI